MKDMQDQFETLSSFSKPKASAYFLSQMALTDAIAQSSYSFLNANFKKLSHLYSLSPVRVTCSESLPSPLQYERENIPGRRAKYAATSRAAISGRPPLDFTRVKGPAPERVGEGRGNFQNKKIMHWGELTGSRK